jgi:hypothetical protein
MEVIVLSDRRVDIRPVTLRGADAVVDAIRREVASSGADGAYLNGFRVWAKCAWRRLSPWHARGHV